MKDLTPPNPQPSGLERLADSLPVQIGVAAIAAASGGVAGALLPILTQSLAHGRASQRVEAALEGLQADLMRVQEQVRALTDAQYRLIGGIVAVILETIDDEKLRLLRGAALNVAGSDYLGSFEAQLFSRILRDISAAEVSFLAKHSSRPWISFGNPETGEVGPFHTLENPPPLFLRKESSEGAIVIGLINLGLVVRSAAEGTMSDVGAYVFSPLVPELLRLLNGRD